MPPRAGVGLKPCHYSQILADRPDMGFFEVHAENYMGAGGPPHRHLEAIRAQYPLSVHGVGLSIGSSQSLDPAHLQRLRELLDRYEPELFSEHLAWSSHGKHFLNDLLPLPYTQETLAQVCRHVDEVQSTIRRTMLLENPSTYVTFVNSTLAEEEFLTEVTKRTGCGLLLDVNNVYVSSVNQGRDASAYLASFPVAHVAEIHLAGFAESVDGTGERLLIDHHGAQVDAVVWQLYSQALQRVGPVPTLIEWDNDIPTFSVLQAEAKQAELLMLRTHSTQTAMDTPRAIHLG